MPIRCLLLTAAVFLVTLSCSKGPAPPKPGTPAFFWSAANQSYRSGDFVKTRDALLQVTSTENEYTARARVWTIVLAGGLAQGYAELGDAYEAGARMNRDNPGAFRRQAASARAAASRASLQCVEAFHGWVDTAKDPAVALTFPFPSAEIVEHNALGKLKKGILPIAAEAEALERSMLDRGVVQRASRMVTAEGDRAEATAVYQKGEVARERFFASAARSLYDQADLFGSKKLDQPRRLQVLCTEALGALGTIPSTKETKDLEVKLRKVLKTVKASS